jgi:hypothetical protein
MTSSLIKFYFILLLPIAYLACGKSTIDSNFKKCGNQILDPGEECDTGILSGLGSCPTETSCKEENPCFPVELTGTGCQTSCIHLDAITEAIDDDGCCPTGMSSQDDNDCDQEQAIIIEIEAESGNTFGQMQIQTGELDDPACADSWIEVPSGPDNFVWSSSNPSLPDHRIEIPINLPVSGTYYVWVRMASPSVSQDAMHLGFDVNDLRRVHLPLSYDFDQSWVWFSILGDNLELLTFEEMPAGEQTLILGHGEAGARIDKVVMTNDRSAQFNRSCGESPDQVCGDGSISGNEICDPNGNLLNGATCISEGYDSGQLGCQSNCLAYDYTDCTNNPDDVCGDGDISGNEVCDTNGNVLNGASCISEGYEGGQLACLSDCLGYDYSGCTVQGESCGDGLISGNEVCDTNGNVMNGATCISEGYLGSGLTCRNDCHAFDYTACDIPVIPGARGFGITTPAGRGGTIYKVTNLNDSGPGSLREAIEASGPRVVIFEVSGNIVISNSLVIHNPNITIAGQTAPSPGITIYGAPFGINAPHILLQHLRTRLGLSDYKDSLGIGSMLYQPHDIVVDHLSISWSNDENIGIYADDLTIKNCIIADPLDSKGVLVMDGDNVAFVENLFANNNDRNPLLREHATGGVITNNVIYNAASHKIYFGSQAANGTSAPLLGSAIGNIVIKGPDSYSDSIAVYIHPDIASGSRIYSHDNKYLLSYGASWSDATDLNEASSSAQVSSPPITIPSYNPRPSTEILDWVIDNAGARPNDRDSLDNQVVNRLYDGIGGYISDEDQIGGLPPLAENYRALTVPSDPHEDPDLNGYTNLEEWLHGFAQGVEN